MTAKERNMQSVTMMVDRTLLAWARAADINSSATLTVAMDVELRRDEADKWQEENREAIDALNCFHDDRVVSVMDTGRFRHVIPGIW